MPSSKCEGLSYPTHFLKSRGSVTRNNFLEYRTKGAQCLTRGGEAAGSSLTGITALWSLSKTHLS